MALFMNLALGSREEMAASLHIPIFLEPQLSRKGCLDFHYTHVLCVNKCLQFYIEDGVSVRASNCIFFTFIDFKTMILYISVSGELLISFMANI